MRLAGVTASRRSLLEWYEPRRFAYPWRTTSDPYAVLVSEFMLQQTQAARVVPAFERFLARFPTVDLLSSARLGDVIRAWEGLGYNRRAVSLHRAATTIVTASGRTVPRQVHALRALPGVGPYTAAAVASIAYGVRVAAVDTNVERVVSRVWAIDDEARVVDAASAWLDPADPGAWNQAVMDLGRAVCRPKPRCAECPLRSMCRSRAAAPARPVHRPGERFEGSSRQLRGAVVDVLRRRGTASLGSLARAVGRDLAAVSEAVRSLHEEGLIVGRPAALAGRSAGVVRLP